MGSVMVVKSLFLESEAAVRETEFAIEKGIRMSWHQCFQ
ncbi:hypothetical protein COLO4_02836 [Corchorus olitorius]|uniref:Uncharacterized protein n=1 Tax=Corchorus olitorius TaxID=93759 RepID=A0A1R3L082_9ROSI|nr:hypothetical protein COLO4_02836 [Corchorus olitorius]